MTIVQIHSDPSMQLLNYADAVHIYNDGGHVHNFYQVIQERDTFEELRKRLDLSLVSERSYQEAFDMCWNKTYSDMVDHAAAFFILTQHYGVAARTVRNLSSAVSSYLRAIEGLEGLHQRLSSVILLDRDPADMVEAWDKLGVTLIVSTPYLDEQTRKALLAVQHAHVVYYG